MTDKMRDLRNGVFCCLVFLGCYLLAWPVANMGFADDWSYIETARVFAQTGQIAYNGWASPMLGWMIPWGALFIKVFGFSFMAVKLSMLPVALGCLLLLYAVLRRFELRPWNAVLGTLTLGLCPIFLALSASFESDIPGLLVILLCLYFCQRALAAATDRSAIIWLILAAVTNVIGGTARQVAWLGVLVMIPCTGWLLRRRAPIVGAVLSLWAGGVISILACMSWFALQPYSVPLSILPRVGDSFVWWIAFLIRTANSLESLVLCLLLFIFPLLMVWLRYFGRKLWHYLILLSLGLLPLAVVRQLMGQSGKVWPGQILFAQLSMKQVPGWLIALNLQKSLIPIPVQIAISLILISAVLGLAFFAGEQGYFKVRLKNDSQGAQFFWLLAPYSLAYFVLLLVVVWHWLVWDKYVLGLMPPVIVSSIWFYERAMDSSLPRFATLLLIFYAGIGVAGTHTLFACKRAQIAGIRELRKAGVPRSEIDGGFEYDAWTQIRDGGHVNNPGIKTPAGAFHQRTNALIRDPLCDEWILSRTPDVHPIYTLGSGEKRCFQPSRFPPVHYTAWLPPFHRVVEVQRVPEIDGVGSLRQDGTRGGVVSP